MTRAQFRTRLLRRARLVDISLDQDALDRLEVYFSLLTKWNNTINLTSLPLDTLTNAAVDRLLVEPLAATRYVSDSSLAWVDVGSGGGSPAIPIKILRPLASLTMIESKARKAAFLNQVVRTLRLRDVRVENQRFEEYATSARFDVNLLTLRAVKANARFFAVSHQLLTNGARLMIFGSAPSSCPGFKPIATMRLAKTPGSILSIFEPMFHVEQDR